jgi:O-antigen/teichoic acid export membrane protein
MTIGAGLAVLATPLVVVLFSEKWTEAGQIMTPLAIMYGLTCIVFPLGDTFKALGRQPTMVAVNAVTIPVGIGVMVLTAPAGVVPVAWARLGVTVAQAAVWFVLISRALDLRLMKVTSMLRPAAATAGGVAIAGAAVRVALPQAAVVPVVLGALACCVGGALGMRTFANREYAELRDLVRRRILSAPIIPARWRSTPPIPSVDPDQVEVVAEPSGSRPAQ